LAYVRTFDTAPAAASHATPVIWADGGLRPSLRSMKGNSTLQPTVGSEVSISERRHPRVAVSLAIPLHLTRRVFFPAELVDVSPTGFRARHHSRGLKRGTVVHAWGFVTARVVWTRQCGGISESGFELA
jgi:hypothetical protein